MMTSLSKLFHCGYCIQIEHGRLAVSNVTGQEVQLNQQQSESLISDIAGLVDIPLAHYKYYTAGKFKGRYEGINLQLKCLNIRPYARFTLFNAELTYQRTNKKYGKKKGDSLPENQFTPRPESDFIKLWEACKIPKPASRTRYYERMGKLKDIILTGKSDPKNDAKLNKLSPFEISHTELEQLLAHNQRISSTQLTHNNRITPAHKESPKHYVIHALEPDSNYGGDSLRLKVIRKSGNKIPLEEYKDDGIAAYPVENKQTISPQRQTINEWLEEYERS